MAVAGFLATGVTAAPQGRAQTGTQELPAFEVASVKPTPPGGTGLTSIGPFGAGRFTATNVTLEVLVEMAFGVLESQILRAPNWLASEYYDIDAKPEGGVSLTYEQLKPRLQQLLAQRLKLSTHRQMKDFEGYALVVAKGGPKLKTDTPVTSEGAVIFPNGLRLPGASMERLALTLVRPLGCPVVDKTGIKGTYNIALSYAKDADVDPRLPSIFTALQEQLGLKLERQKVPVEMLVIDHVERIPTEN
ncbi:MAG TPA: TIGR03435 family protein [Bryobacteraceae bacterium]|nr:TIGR03435 family protein [Bryobacteraceae bacterium]